MRVHFDEKTHTYTVGGAQVVSVTTALQRAGMTDQFPYSGGQGAERGKRVHRLCEHRDKGRRVCVPRDLSGFVRGWDKFLKDTGFIPELIEELVYCPEHGYAGTLDRVGRFEDEADSYTTVLDIKTSNRGSVPVHSRWQLAAYGYALDPHRTFARLVVCLRPDGRYKEEVYPVSEYWDDFERFRQALKPARLHDILFGGP